MNNDGTDSLLDARGISSPMAPSHGARQATEEGAVGGAVRAPDPEVVATAKRRQFSASEKRRIVSAADACKKPGELGALLRQEGIYSSMLSNWRKQIARANEQALAPRQRGPKPDPARPERLRIERLERENARLERELQKAHLIIDVQKKNGGLARDRTGSTAQGQRRVIDAFDTLRSGLDVATACQSLGVPRAAIYRARQRRSRSEQLSGRQRVMPRC
jgi:transposase